MRFKDTFMEMPVKKAVVLVVLSILFLMFAIQSLFINKIFSIINRSITHFEHIAKDDKRELDKDLREVNEEIAYDRARSAHETEYLNLRSDAPPQAKGCFHWNSIKQFEAMLTLPYVKHQQFARAAVERQLRESREAVNQAIAKHEFDPTLCDKGE